MADLTDLILAKSDQLNADDLIAGAITIKITAVKRVAGEQPIAISYEGDNGKPWKPCKSMMRILVSAWGADGKAYVGRGLTLYRDPKVKWAGMEVGGIRISHMTNITGEFSTALTVTKGNKKPYIVKPLVIATKNTTPQAITEEEINALKYDGKEAAGTSMDALKEWWQSIGATKQKILGVAFLDEMKTIANKADKDAPI